MAEPPHPTALASASPGPPIIGVGRRGEDVLIRWYESHYPDEGLAGRISKICPSLVVW